MRPTPDKYITINGINTRYWNTGQGEKTLVFVHGLCASVEYWENNINALAKHYRVIALDLIGFGKTDIPKIDYTDDVFISFLKAFLDTLSIQNCILVGHSLGGAICLQFALRFPKNTEKLILVSSAGFSRKIPIGLRLLTLPFMKKTLQYTTPAIMGKILRHYAYQKDRITEPFIQTMHKLRQLPNADYALTNLVRHHANLFGIKRRILKPLQKQLSQLQKPVLIIWGRQDLLLSVKGAHRAKKLLPHAVLKIFDHCGHMPQIEYPELFNQTVIDFCRTN